MKAIGNTNVSIDFIYFIRIVETLAMWKRMAQKLEPIADDYGHRYDDDTSCYLLENIKFKLNYIWNYSGGDGK